MCGFKNASTRSFKTPPCMPAPRAPCVSTCARGAGTHGDVLNPHTGAGGDRQFYLPKFVHVRLSRASEVRLLAFVRISNHFHIQSSAWTLVYLKRVVMDVYPRLFEIASL